jgi:hypothetical protein
MLTPMPSMLKFSETHDISVTEDVSEVIQAIRSLTDDRFVALTVPAGQLYVNVDLVREILPA